MEYNHLQELLNAALSMNVADFRRARKAYLAMWHMDIVNAGEQVMTAHVRRVVERGEQRARDYEYKAKRAAQSNAMRSIG